MITRRRFFLSSAVTGATQGYLDPQLIEPVSALRHHNPLLFDFVLKRHLRFEGKSFSARVFETGKTFARLGNNENKRKG